MSKLLIQNYLFTIISFIVLMISMVTINLLNQPLLKISSYLSLPLSLLITIYGIIQINKVNLNVNIEV